MIYITRIVDYSYEETLDRVIEVLKEQGFGIVAEIDIKKVMKEKLDVVQEHEGGKVEVTTFNPIANMPGRVDPRLEELSKDVECKLKDVIQKL
jgi:uncharacterized protein (DUF302 family)